MRRLMIFAVALLALAACNKSLDNGQSEKQIKPGETITLSARVSNTSTKVTTDDIDANPVNFKWESGDKVVIFLMKGTSQIEESQVFTLKEGTISADGKSADFTGKALSSMESYYAMYCGTNADETTVKNCLVNSKTVLDNVRDNYNIVVSGSEGTTEGFTLNRFPTTLHLELTGSVTIGKIEFVKNNAAVSTINCKNGVTLTSTPQDFLIPVGYQYGPGFTLKFYDTGGNLIMQKVTSYEILNPGQFLKFPALEVKKALPEGALPGVFSVSADKKVYFSKGNLQATYNGSSYTWGFAANQWDYIGNAAGNTTIDNQEDGAKVDLFGWSTSAIYGISTSKLPIDYSGDFKDWGTAIDDKGTWRTLSLFEWMYLLNFGYFGARTQTNYYAKANVNGVVGLLIFPDGYNGSTAVTGVNGIATVNTTDAPFPSSSIASATWETMEEDGCVFLPVTGHRQGSSIDGVDRGYYWSSSSLMEGEAGYLYFNSGEINPACSYSCYNGTSVRLVTNVQ